MKTKDICKELTLTRQGLYFMIKKHKEALGKHVYKNNEGRWEVDDEGLAILKEEREKNKTVIVQPTSDEAIASTIRGMEIKIRDLKYEIRMLKEIQVQGEILLNSVDDTVNEMEIGEQKRNLAAAAKHYKMHTTKDKIKKVLRREDREKAKIARKKAQEEKIMAQYDAIQEYISTGSTGKLGKYLPKKAINKITKK